MSAPGPDEVAPLPEGAPAPAELLELARRVAVEAASGLELALAGDERASTISSKTSGTDLVTEMDRWSERLITERILAERPDDTIRGEEGVDVAGTSRVSWCIDPIDGTVNFVHGIPGFCVSIAAEVDGRAVAGAVVSPLHDDVFTATLGGGAFRNDQPISCSDPVGLEMSVIGTGFGYRADRRRRQAEVLTEVITHIADIRRCGAAAIDLCWVACGRLDGYWEVGLGPWDHAAGALIATEAGAICGGLDGGPPSSELTMAAAPAIWSPLRDLLLGAGAASV